MIDPIEAANAMISTLDSLPPRSVVMDGEGEVWRKLGGGRLDCLDANGDQSPESSETVVWAATRVSVRVLWRPDAEPVVAEEPEWEYVVVSTFDALRRETQSPITDEGTARIIAADPLPGMRREILRRRPAGPWVPVKQEGESDER